MATKAPSSVSKNSGHAPDLELLGDTITLQPRGFEQDVQEDGDKERNLVEHMARFRTSPLEYVLPHHFPCIKICRLNVVSWRNID